MKPKSGSAWLNKIERECPYQVVLRRKKLMDESDIFDFLESIIGNFDMFVEDDYANFVRYCFKDKNDADIFYAKFHDAVELISLSA